MGCDIHFFVEAKHPETGNWEHVSFRDFYVAKLAEEVGSEEAAKTVAGLQAQGNRYDGSISSRLQWRGWYSGRNYRLFGVLAGVRDSGVPRIDNPRGMPEDVSPHVRFYPHGIADAGTPEERAKSLADHYGVAVEDLKDEGIDIDKPGEDLLNDDEGVDWHSRTWLTAKELDEFDWDQGSSDSGTVNASTYALWKAGGGEGAPLTWSGSGGGGTVILNSVAEMDAWVAEHGLEVDASKVDDKSWAVPSEAVSFTKKTPDLRTEPYVRLSWGESLRTRCGHFIDTTIADMKELARLRQLPLDSVRAVFYFDN